jgi:hypothetical protein
MADKSPGKEPPLEDILNKDGKMMRSPLLWFVLLIVPVAVAFYFGLQAEGKAVSDLAVREEVVAYTPETQQKQASPLQKQYEGRRGGGPECPHMDKVGKPADQALQDELKAAGKAFRIIPPGGIATMDYSAERVNFDVDAGNLIVRVWCG